MPDLKEAAGGLRDATVLKALVATWLVDVPHGELERCRLALLDVRDVVQDAAGRATDRVAPELWDDVATGLALADARAAQVHVRELGRRITHLSRLTWRRVDDVLARPTSARLARRPALAPLAAGVALAAGEVVLDARARPAQDPELLLRACAAAAEHDALLAPATAARLARECPPLGEPWSAEARRLLVRLLASGPGLLPIWETLEETGALSLVLPEWERIRMLPHASVIHRFTVDRHVVETCIEASALIRDVGRPDVLMVAALLHDIGKGGLTEHCVAGEPIARRIATRMGFEPEAVELVALLVRRHLLLAETATTRDPDDPATVDLVAGQLGGAEALSLLLALTEADARAASAQAWSSWRAGLVRDLARRVRAALDTGVAAPAVVPEEVEIDRSARAGPGVLHRRGVGGRRQGHRRRARPGRAAGGHRGGVRAPAGRRARRPRLGAGRVRRLRLGGRRARPRPGGPAPALRGRSRRAVSTRGRGCGRPRRGRWPRAWRCVPRPPTRPPCWRSGPPTGPASSTWSAPRWPRST